MMNLNEYQNLAGRTAGAGDRDQQLRLAVAGLGLTGEAGEVAEKIKKHVGHSHDLDIASLRKELGDVMWYLAEICTITGLSLDDVAEQNIDKLRRRYPEGFNVAASHHQGE